MHCADRVTIDQVLDLRFRRLTRAGAIFAGGIFILIFLYTNPSTILSLNRKVFVLFVYHSFDFFVLRAGNAALNLQPLQHFSFQVAQDLELLASTTFFRWDRFFYLQNALDQGGGGRLFRLGNNLWDVGLDKLLIRVGPSILSFSMPEHFYRTMVYSIQWRPILAKNIHLRRFLIKTFAPEGLSIWNLILRRPKVVFGIWDGAVFLAAARELNKDMVKNLLEYWLP